MTHRSVGKLFHHWSDNGLSCLAANQYLKQCWIIINWNLAYNLHCKWSKNTNVCHQENVLENIVWTILDISFTTSHGSLQYLQVRYISRRDVFQSTMKVSSMRINVEFKNVSGKQFELKLTFTPGIYASMNLFIFISRSVFLSLNKAIMSAHGNSLIIGF